MAQRGPRTAELGTIGRSLFGALLQLHSLDGRDVETDVATDSRHRQGATLTFRQKKSVHAHAISLNL